MAFFLAAGCMYLSERFGVHGLAYVGLAFLGLASLSSGLRVIATRRATFLPSGAGSLRRRAESYAGCAAQAWGVFFVLFGLVALMGGAFAAFFPIGVGRWMTQLLETPAGWGLLSGTLGTFAALYGFARVLAGAASANSGAVGFLRDAAYRGLGALVLLTGLALLAIAVGLLASPSHVTGIVNGWLTDLGLR
jgi:hypothetical protein